MIIEESKFEPLTIRKRALVAANSNQYRVTTRAGELKEIEAQTAYEAFKLSGFKDAVKIERISNIDKSILTKEQFQDVVAPAAAAVAEGAAASPADVIARVKSRKTPIVSADELDEMMQALQAMAAASAAQAAANAQSASAVPQAGAPAEMAAPGPAGTEVHGDGFDEIIPAATAAKPPAAGKPAEPKEAVKAEPQPADAPTTPPASELSPEEVDKLLGGK